jgi:hypothetical protein
LRFNQLLSAQETTGGIPGFGWRHFLSSFCRAQLFSLCANCINGCAPTIAEELDEDRRLHHRDRQPF